MQFILDRIREHAFKQPNAEAVVLDKRIVDYATLWGLIDSAALELKSYAISRLGIYHKNSLSWIVIDLAAALVGIPVVPIPLFFSAEQRAHLIKDSGIDYIFCPTDSADVAGHRLETYTSILSDCHYLRIKFQPESSAPFTKVTYTSGSTGQPKGVCLSGASMVSITQSLSEALADSKLKRHLCLIPFATLLENVAGVYVALAMGRSVVVDDVNNLGWQTNHSFDVHTFANAIAHYKAESVITLPQILKSIVENANLNLLTSLKFIAVGGGKVPTKLIQECNNLGMAVYEGYGLSECASVVSLNTPKACRIGSVGKPLPHSNVHISAAGEVIVTGCAMQGYLNDEAHSPIIQTGDSGYIDKDGYLFITGRIKDTIISSFGRNISPEWVESHFMSHPAIQNICVFGEAKASLSAVLNCSPSLSADELENIIQSINAGLPDYARVEQWCRAAHNFSVADKTLTENGKLCRTNIFKKNANFLNATEGTI